MSGNWTTTQRVIKQFYINEDLTYKAEPFISEIDSMRASMLMIYYHMRNELSKQKGLMIEALQDENEKFYENIMAHTEGFRNLMKNAAKIYDDHISSMSFQDLTLTVEYIKMNHDD